MLKAVDLRTEYLINPIGIDNTKPRLGWKILSNKKNVMQNAYQIQASYDKDFKNLIWDSGKVNSDQSQRVIYNGPELKSMNRIYWKVKVWCNEEESDFSEIAYFEMGLLEKSDWKAKWIEPENDIEIEASKPAPFIRKEFLVKKGLVSARAYMTARGLYKFYINGREGTDNLFTPGFTSYYKRLQYQTYDITGLLKEGKNALGVILGDGWWRGSTGGGSIKNNFGYKLAFLGQIVLLYEDGNIEIIGSDETFKTSYGPILKSDLKEGEIYDARKDIDGWNMPDYDDSLWQNVNIREYGLENLVATRSVPVREKERFSPKVIKTPKGETVLDFGQNIAGWVEMKVTAPEGTEIVLIHGETLDKDGNFTIENIKMLGRELENFQEIHYISAGKDLEYYKPHFTIFGFRYVLVKNYPGEVNPENFTAVAIYSDMDETGYFECSNELINKLVMNTKWSMKGNFLDIPTDCPTRERAGWTGDAQIFCKSATYLMNVYPFFEKWLLDLKTEQYSNGCVGNTIPSVIGYHNVEEIERLKKTLPNEMMTLTLSATPDNPSILEGSAGWGDAAVIIPWTLFLCYGDKNILKNQYESAKAWVDYMDRCAKDANPTYENHLAYHSYTNGELDANFIWDTKYHWGEWLEPDNQPNNSLEDMREWFKNKITYSEPIVATAYYAYSSHLLSEMANVLGNTEDAKKYSDLFEKIKLVYNKYFINDEGYIINMDGNVFEDRQAPYVRVLAFNLVYDDKKKAVADKLVKIIKEKDYHLNTGFLSTPYLLHVLLENGYKDVAYKLLEQKTCPSWLYAVTKGATTIWERWNGIKEDGSVVDSLNHYSYGAVCDFLFSKVCGIQPVFDKPGYKEIIIKPDIGGTLTFASTIYESTYGIIKSSWVKKENEIVYNFIIPCNTRAKVMLIGDIDDLTKIKKDFENATLANDRIVFNIGSGEYTVTLKNKSIYSI